MIITKNDDGNKLIITGTILKADGVTPYPDVFLYAYHTDKTGHYSKNGKETGIQKWHGALHGWCKTDKNGKYEIHTIRPARYPEGKFPAHIHAAIKEPSKEPYYISDFVFNDDEFVDSLYLNSFDLPGGKGVVDVIKKDGTWIGQRNIITSQ
jgi:protocatechuate 3,4-dioxygenase beta subunit